jgi:hypothetical protein
MTNRLKETNDHLFKALDRLSAADMDEERLALEIKRANAVAGVAREVLNTGKLALEAYRVAGELGRQDVIDAVMGTEPERLEAGE